MTDRGPTHIQSVTGGLLLPLHFQRLQLQARALRAQQIGEGVKRRLHHATNKLTSVRNSLAQASVWPPV